MKLTRLVSHFLLLCCFGLMLGPAQAQPKAGKRVALVIGNDAYQHVSKLQKAGNDAAAIARELKAAGFEVLLHRDLNYRGMVRAVEDFAGKIAGGDQVVVFFAGHGVQIKSGSYLLPVDIEATSESEVEKTAYSLADLTEKIGESKAGFSLVLVDACRDNPLKSYGRGVGGSRGLSAIEPPKGQMVVYSASRGQQALDRLNERDANPNGVFTREFIARMRRPGVRIEDMVREVQDAVEALAKSVNHEQRPAIYNEARGNFYFFGPTTVQVAPTADRRGRTPEEIEDAYWDGIKEAGDSAAFNAYLADYPKGRYASLARSALKKLGSEANRAQVPGEDAESAFWNAASKGGAAEDYEVYLKQYPKGKYAAQARQMAQKLKSEARRADRPDDGLQPLKKAANDGDQVAMLALGDRYSSGNGVTRSPSEATSWYRKAAAAGNALAEFKLSEAYKSSEKQYVEDIVRILSLPIEQQRNVTVSGQAAARQFVESDPFFEMPAGSQSVEYTFNSKSLEHGGPAYQRVLSAQTNSCTGTGRLSKTAYKTKKILDYDVEGLAVLGGLLPLDIKTGFGFMKSYKVELAGISSIHGQPFPLAAGKRFGMNYRQFKTDGRSFNPGTSESAESISCVAGGAARQAGADTLVCLYQSEQARASYLLARYVWDQSAGCFVQNYESDGTP